MQESQDNSLGFCGSFNAGESFHLSDLDLSLGDSSEISSSSSEKPPSVPKLELPESEESDGWMSEDILDGVDEEKEEIFPERMNAKCNIISRKNKLPSPRAAELVVRDLEGDLKNLKQQIADAKSDLKQAHDKNKVLRKEKKELKLKAKSKQKRQARRKEPRRDLSAFMEDLEGLEGLEEMKENHHWNNSRVSDSKSESEHNSHQSHHSQMFQPVPFRVQSINNVNIHAPLFLES